ncbi:MAG: response regulator [Candidatus Acidiferrum sp.]
MSKVLIADEQASTRKSLTKLLEREKYEVESVADGRKLLEKLQTAAPDLLLVDVVMPKMNGRRVIEQMRELGLNVPVLMMCTKQTNPAKIPEGAADCISKPFHPGELVTRVRRALETTKRRPGVEVTHRELHDPKTGRIDAKKMAQFLGISLGQLAGALKVSYPAVHKTPFAPNLQESLRPIKRSIDLISAAALSPEDARAWLNSAHPDLDERAPIDVILAGDADAVVTLLSNAMAGIPS